MLYLIEFLKGEKQLLKFKNYLNNKFLEFILINNNFLEKFSSKTVAKLCQ